MRRSAASLSAFLAALLSLAPAVARSQAAPKERLAQAGSSSVEVVPPDAAPGTAATRAQPAEPSVVPPPPPLPPPPPPPLPPPASVSTTHTDVVVDGGESVTVVTSERVEVGPQAAPGTA